MMLRSNWKYIIYNADFKCFNNFKKSDFISIVEPQRNPYNSAVTVEDFKSSTAIMHSYYSMTKHHLRQIENKPNL